MAFVGRFFLLVLVVGFVELYLLVGAARSIGFLTTVGLCVLTGVVGGSLVRHQGLATMQQVSGAMARGQLPAQQIVSGVVLMIVGVLLITPGFITDVLGFLLLIPPLRLAAATLLLRSLEKRVELMHGEHIDPRDPFGAAPGQPPRAGHGRPGASPRSSRVRGRVIDVEVDADEDAPGSSNDAGARK